MKYKTNKITLLLAALLLLTTLTVDDISLNGSTISDAGDLTLDVGGDIILDAGGAQIRYHDDGTDIGINDSWIEGSHDYGEGSWSSTAIAADKHLFLGLFKKTSYL